MDNKVYAVRCTDYAQAGEKLEALLDMMGGMGRFAKAGETLALKVNLLESIAPDRAVTTHPSVVAAVAAQTARAGAKAVILDSPGGGHWQNSPAALEKLYSVTGMAEAARQSGAVLNYDMSREQRSFPQGELVRSFEVLSAPFQADGIINLCKLKTHMFMMMTGAVKNTFGLIPGLAKAGCHTRFQSKEQFAHMLLDLCALAAPRLSVMDAVVGMEGAGPGASGTPRPVGLLLASENPLALDVVAGAVMGLRKADNPLLLAAEQRELGPVDLDQVELIGLDKTELPVPGYRLPPAPKGNMVGLPAALNPLVDLARRALSATPRMTEACVGCGICAASCPVKAIAVKNRRARINTGKCIRCYCCHELCPHKAVELHTGVLSRLLRG
ncbi:DUF362 domain-containing protein [uncultured Pseudoflavonifractor sp.]|uniref:DUF362 domain-containing protein n=1 Tax=uncultured Pseudoflavonifractor sp. TaxID=1221379 RepID=UPI0025F7FCA7|nr:DUF362 domain-containing protein [uncultured Pseudoflavonifractor sp.]